jgi:hypothetical protein
VPRAEALCCGRHTASCVSANANSARSICLLRRVSAQLVAFLCLCTRRSLLESRAMSSPIVWSEHSVVGFASAQACTISSERLLPICEPCSRDKHTRKHNNTAHLHMLLALIRTRNTHAHACTDRHEFDCYHSTSSSHYITILVPCNISIQPYCIVLYGNKTNARLCDEPPARKDTIFIFQCSAFESAAIQQS